MLIVCRSVCARLELVYDDLRRSRLSHAFTDVTGLLNDEIAWMCRIGPRLMRASGVVIIRNRQTYNSQTTPRDYDPDIRRAIVCYTLAIARRHFIVGASRM